MNDSTKLNRVLLILGRKPLRNKDLHPAFEEQLKLALNLLAKYQYDLILISGGQTRKKFPAESKIGYEYLKKKTTVPIIQENQSHTTIENILFSKKIFEHNSISRLDIITSEATARRSDYLFKRLWPELYGQCSFYGAVDSYFFLYPIVEMIYLLYAAIDIQEMALPKLLKKVFRNAA